MGLFFESICFRRPGQERWQEIKTEIAELLGTCGLDPQLLDLEQDKESYGVCGEDGLSGCFGYVLPQLSRVTGDYALGTVCVDSDFLVVYLFRGGELVQFGTIGEPYEAIEGVEGLLPEKWLPLLKDGNRKEEFLRCLRGEDYVFIEDAARELSMLTGLPIIDDEALFGFDED